MMTRSTLYRLTAPTVLVLSALSGCDSTRSEPLAVDRLDVAAAHGRHAADAGLTSDPAVAGWLAGLRQATAPFHRIAAAGDAGWDARITGCMELPGTGGMGYHYGNVGLIDGVPEEFAPELLVYEPVKNGGLRLVAVEYIVPFAAWTGAAPPSLHGVEFHRNESFGLWVLHAWVWKHNPAGIFADWNPDVTCEFAAATES